MSKKKSDSEMNQNDEQETPKNQTEKSDTEKSKKEDNKPKKQERELPDWMIDKSTVNELKFCRYFVRQHPLKCIRGRFYDYTSVPL